MMISGFNSYYDYSVIKSETEKVNNAVPAVNDVPKNESEAVVNAQGNLNNAPKNSLMQDFSFDFKIDPSFGMTGKDSSLEALDIERAISDMKKDKVLDQYKFFVDSPKAGYVCETGDGSVRRIK